MRRCYQCGQAWVSDKARPGVKEFCENCTAYLHCCRNCRFYDKHAHNQCSITTTEWVPDKEGPNFCDDFEFADTEADSDSTGATQDAREAFGRLFGQEGDGSDAKDNSVNNFRKLFGD